MRTSELVDRLDKELGIVGHPENLLDWAVNDENRASFDAAFLERNTACALAGAEDFEEVVTVVFITDGVIDQLTRRAPSFVFTHHPFDCHEDERGIEPLRPAQLEKLLGHGHTLYVAHAPLDSHPVFGTSRVLAELLAITPESGFFEYAGTTIGVIGRIEPAPFPEFAEHTRLALERPIVATVQERGRVDRVAVAAGGGDFPQIAEEVAAAGCDTLVTGPVENRWQNTSVQENHRRFRELCHEYRLNLIGGTHYATERPAMVAVLELFRSWGLPATYLEDDDLLNAT